MFLLAKFDISILTLFGGVEVNSSPGLFLKEGSLSNSHFEIRSNFCSSIRLCALLLEINQRKICTLGGT